MKWFLLLALFSCSSAGPQYKAKAALRGVAHGFMYYLEEAGVRYYYQFESKRDENWIKLNLNLLNTKKEAKKIKAIDFSITANGKIYHPVEKIQILTQLEKEVVARKDNKPIDVPEAPVMFSEKEHSTNLVKTLTNEIIMVDRYMLEPEISLVFDSSMKTYVLFKFDLEKPESFELRLNPNGDSITVYLDN